MKEQEIDKLIEEGRQQMFEENVKAMKQERVALGIALNLQQKAIIQDMDKEPNDKEREEIAILKVAIQTISKAEKSLSQQMTAEGSPDDARQTAEKVLKEASEALKQDVGRSPLYGFCYAVELSAVYQSATGKLKHDDYGPFYGRAIVLKSNLNHCIGMSARHMAMSDQLYKAAEDAEGTPYFSEYAARAVEEDAISALYVLDRCDVVGTFQDLFSKLPHKYKMSDEARQGLQKQLQHEVQKSTVLKEAIESLDE